MIKAIIGLGNPGPRFTNTRHNIGFLVLDKLAEQHNVDFKEKSLTQNAPAMITTFDGIELIKPLTYMNDSGKIIPYLFKKGVSPQEIIVVHDEMEKKLGTVSSRIGGSARGHNGLKSIINFGAGDCWRIRCGIDRPTNKDDVPDYVLGNFENQEIIANLTDNALNEIYQIIKKS
jgi:PTH1 family peptidyl-tRNA hydrolase